MLDFAAEHACVFRTGWLQRCVCRFLYILCRNGVCACCGPDARTHRQRCAVFCFHRILRLDQLASLPVIRLFHCVHGDRFNVYGIFRRCRPRQVGFWADLAWSSMRLPWNRCCGRQRRRAPCPARWPHARWPHARWPTARRRSTPLSVQLSIISVR